MVKAASSSRSTAEHWLLHVELLDTELFVWRRVVVPSDLYLDDLHAFRIGDVVYGGVP